MRHKSKDIIFYTLEKSIKSYRQFAQKRLDSKGYNITIDQWLVLKTLEENDDVTQQQMAEIVFKDYASITRIIEILVNKSLIRRSSHHTDRRRFELTLTPEAKKLVVKIQNDIDENRRLALVNISRAEMAALGNILGKIILNCTGATG